MWFVTSQKNGVSALGLQRVLGLGSSRRRGPGSTSCERWSGPVGLPHRRCRMSAAKGAGKPKQRPSRGGDREEGSRHRPDPPSARQGRVLGLPSSLRPECRVARVGGPYRRMEWLSRAGEYQHQVTVISDGSEPAHEVMPRVGRFSSGGCSAPTRAAFSTGISTTTSTNSPPIQSTALTSPGAALPTRPTGCRCRTDSLPHHHRSCRFRSPDSGTGVKGIPSLEDYSPSRC